MTTSIVPDRRTAVPGPALWPDDELWPGDEPDAAAGESHREPADDVDDEPWPGDEPDDEPGLLTPGPVTALASRLSPDAMYDGDDVAAAIESLGVSDRAARERYGMPSVFSLGDAILDQLRHGRLAIRSRHGARRAPAPRSYLAAALLRCAVYLGPLSAAVAASAALDRVAWQVPATTLLLGWGAAQALASVGAAVSGKAGPATAARLLAGGFGAALGVWGALIWIAPAGLVGPDRLLAAAIGVGGLVALGTVTAALVTRAEAAVARWSLPLWALGVVACVDDWAGHTPTAVLLPLAIALPAARAFRPAFGRSAPPRPALTADELRQAVSYLVIGAAQAMCLALLWQAGPSGPPPPAVLPLLAAVPMLEALVSWHTSQVDAGLDSFDDVDSYAGHVRSVTTVTVAGLTPPLAVGLALAAAAYRLPYGLSAQAHARDLVLALAGGTLLGGVLAVTLLLAARGHTAAGAVLAASPVALTGIVAVLAAGLSDTAASLAAPPDLLPTIVAVLALSHLVGVVAVGYTALDHRRTP